MRVLMVADDLYPGYGGQASCTQGHIDALLKLGHEVRVLAGEETRPAEAPVPVTRLPVWRPGNKMAHFVKPERQAIAALLDWAEVVHLNTPTPFTLMAISMARRRKRPTVVGFYTQEESAALQFRLARPLLFPGLRAWYSFFYRQPDCLVVPTAFAERLARRYTKKPLYRVSCGIYLPPNGPEEDARAKVLRKELLPHGGHLTAYLGRLSAEKHPQGMLEVFASLKHLRQDVLLAIAGTGPLESAMKAQVAQLGLEAQVRFLGFISEDEKRALLKAADLFMMPSPTELQSIATLEACAQGCAALVADYDSSAVGEWVSEADAGLLYDPRDPEGAAKQVAALLADDERLQALKANARALACTHDVFGTGRQLERLYAELIERAPR